MATLAQPKRVDRSGGAAMLQASQGGSLAGVLAVASRDEPEQAGEVI